MELWICGLNAAAQRLFRVWESPDICLESFLCINIFPGTRALARSPGLVQKSGGEQNSV